MKEKNKVPAKDDELLFAKEDENSSSLQKSTSKKFKLLIVDDEQEVHIMTKLVLSDYTYHNAALDFYSAYSAKEAKKLLKAHEDAALILLDVVMETNSAGLDVAKFIRDELKNEKVRIILRTGQPGEAPEKDIILNYDINDYKEKTELTNQKLFTTVTTALRSFVHLGDLESKSREIADKNVQLNDEIARRVVAESNLAKYNKSLEKIIESKSRRLGKALEALSLNKAQLLEANRLAGVGGITETAIPELAESGLRLSANLEQIDSYRAQMTQLLEEYKVLQDIIGTHTGKFSKINKQAWKMLENIDKLKDQINLEQILKDYPDIIKDSARGIAHVTTVVNDIKMFISINEEPLVDTDIIPIIDLAIDQIVKESKKKIHFQKDYASLPKVLMARTALQKAFAEIVKNSVEAVGSRGIITVETNHEGGVISIDICDNGKGISKKNQEFVFKPYFTTKKNHRGLGLSYARNVLIKYGGDILISSSYNEGTTVSVRINT